MKIMELPLDTAVSRFFDEAERNGLERRLGQVEMSQEIAQAIMDKRSLIVEAEVGIGKSIAYLVPIVQQFFRDRRQVVIATSTIALQEQLERDVHIIREKSSQAGTLTLPKIMVSVKAEPALDSSTERKMSL